MKRHFHQYVISLLCLLALGCDRLTVDSSKISLQVPRSLSGKMNSASSTLMLKHLAVQVTAPDMSQPITLLQDAGGSSSLGSEITLEIPSGSDRLVQVLAAYSPAGSDGGAILYYGDVSKSLAGTTETLDVPLQKLGSESTVEGRLKGRYLSSANAGPSGELKLFYRPPGKPALLVDRKMMFGGWFEMVAFSDIPMDYVLPDGTYMGQQWTTNTLVTGPHLVKVAEPLSFREQWTSVGTSTWIQQLPEDKFFGFFANNPTYLSNKTVCVQSALSNGGSLYSNSHFVSANRNHPMPIKHFATGSTPTATPQALAFIGGRAFSDCASLPPAEEFISYLKFNGNSWDNRIYNIGESSGIVGLQTMFNRPEENPQYRSTSKFGVNSSGVYLETRPLPGALEGINGLQVYRKVTTAMPMPSTEYDERCESERLSSRGWSLYKSLPLPALDNGALKIQVDSLGLAAQTEYQHIICLSRDGHPHGKPNHIWVNNTSPSLPQTLSLSSSPSTGLPFNHWPVVGECRAVQVNLSGSNFAVNPYPSLGYTVTAKDYSDAAAAILYSTKDCSGSPVSTLSKTFTAQLIESTFYIKSASYGNFNLSLTNTLGLTNPSPFNLNVVDPTSTPTSVSLSLDTTNTTSGSFPPLMAVFPQGCHPVAAFFHEGGNPVNNTGTATFSWIELDGVTSYTPPSDIKIVNNCVSRTPQASINVVNGVGRFAVLAGPSLLNNVSLKVDGFGTSGMANLNITPLAHHLSLTLPSGSSTTPQVYQCQAVQVEVRDSSNNPVIIPANKKLSFHIHSRPEIMAQPVDVSFYSDSSCTSQQQEHEVAAGTSSKLIYMKANSLGAFFVGYSSSYTQTMGSSPASEIRLNPTPAPLSVDLGGYSTIPNTVSYGFNIVGGTPPYTATVTQGSATVNVIQPYAPNWQLSVIPSATGPLTIVVQDSAGQSTTVNLTVY
nr:hypothetical protein BdHM001_22890 [Bdellovibrio sp. HM001]